MADQQIGSQEGVASCAINGGTNRSNLNAGGSDDHGGTEFDGSTRTDSISTMRARLQVINAAYYTSAVLNQMTYNDMLYAIRLSDSPTAVK